MQSVMPSTQVSGRRVFSAKKDRLDRVHEIVLKGPGIYRFSHSVTQNFFLWPTMVADIFKDFDLPSKKFLAIPLLLKWKRYVDYTFY